MKKEFGETIPARWNLVGRFLARRRERREFLARLEKEHADLIEFDRQANEQAELRQAVKENPYLMQWAALHGTRGVHWESLTVFVVLQDQVSDEPEMKARFN